MARLGARRPSSGISSGHTHYYLCEALVCVSPSLCLSAPSLFLTRWDLSAPVPFAHTSYLLYPTTCWLHCCQILGLFIKTLCLPSRGTLSPWADMHMIVVIWSEAQIGKRTPSLDTVALTRKWGGYLLCAWDTWIPEVTQA